MSWWDKVSNIKSKIKPSDKIHMGREEKLSFRDMTGEQDKSLGKIKPVGLWYACGDEWLRWIMSEEPEWAKPYLFKIEINPSAMLIINNTKDFDDFEKEYGKMFGEMFGKMYDEMLGIKDENYKKRYKKTKSYIDWSEVAKKYSGIEICPYQHSKRHESMWYYGWDVGSGCIWRSSGIIKIERVL